MSHLIPLTSVALRKLFLDYFQRHQHQVVPSSTLIPASDPSLLFTNAGMVPFKERFLGKPSDDGTGSRVISVQRCMRAGGKHNDLENVGYTARHHTFFEMLGNFSFGDYFKREAIQFAWGFLTETLHIPPDRLWITVFETDDEAATIWRDEVGVPEERIIRSGEKDNFWRMGETGPCGPCSEIFYDHGETVSGGPPGSAEADGDRFVEIWNLVFMQYNSDAQGHLSPLPKPCVDTGMGLERLCAVMQGVHNNFETDLFAPLVQQAESWCAISAENKQATRMSCRVLADHIRATAFLIMDGVLPGAEGRGYVLRRIMRRALRHGHRLNIASPFFGELLHPLVEIMGEAYPLLREKKAHIAQVIAQEEEQFSRTLSQGMRLLEQEIVHLQSTVFPGDLAFKLYDTYGFPLDLTEDIAREKNMTVDKAAFASAMEAQKALSQGHGRFHSGLEEDWTAAFSETRFVGYEALLGVGQVLGFEARSGDDGLWGLILNETPFYAESGGQIGDTGTFRSVDGRTEGRIEDTQKAKGVFVHTVRLTKGSLSIGDMLSLSVDRERRLAIARHHSATHLLHAALRAKFGESVQQRGSWVGPERLRFDFAFHRALSPEDIHDLMRVVQTQILENTPVLVHHLSQTEARAKGAMALFDEKYGQTVRVLEMGGGFSLELCGGTHVTRTGDIGPFWILQDSAVSSGVRRIEAIAGLAVLGDAWAREKRWHELADLLKTSPKHVPERVSALTQKIKQQEKELAARERGSIQDHIEACIQSAVPLAAGGLAIQLITQIVEQAEPRQVRDWIDRIKDRLKGAVIVFASRLNAEKVALYVGVTADLTERCSAGRLVQFLAESLGGRGGGRPDFAQAGASSPDKLPDVFAEIPNWLMREFA